MRQNNFIDIVERLKCCLGQLKYIFAFQFNGFKELLMIQKINNDIIDF